MVLLTGEEEDYELIPKQEVENLKKEIDKLKKNPIGTTKQGENLLDSINILNSNIKKLIDIFTNAESDLLKQYENSNPVEDIKHIKEQNDQIAQGLLAIADLIKQNKIPKPIISSPITEPNNIPNLEGEKLGFPELNNVPVSQMNQPPNQPLNQSIPKPELNLNPVPLPNDLPPNQEEKKRLFSKK